MEKLKHLINNLTDYSIEQAKEILAEYYMKVMIVNPSLAMTIKAFSELLSEENYDQTDKFEILMEEFEDFLSEGEQE